MKKQLNQLRRFFARTGARKLNAATAREVIPSSYDDDDGSNRLSGAFIVVLVLHVIALVGVFAFSRMKDPKVPPSLGNLAKAQAGVAPASGVDRSEPLPSTPASAAAVQPAPAVQYASLQSQKYSAVPAAESTNDPDRGAPDTLRPNLRGSSRSPYVVKNGDNLTKIAVAYSVRPVDLMTANNLKTDDIKPGQELLIPESKGVRPAAEIKALPNAAEKAPAPKAAPGTYKVRKNETLVKIARDLKVSYDELYKLNGIKDPRKLQEGQVLKVPKRG